MNSQARIIISTVLLCLMTSLLSTANAETFPADDRGWYDQDGWHFADNDNYYAGFYSPDLELRNWFLFSIPPGGEILSARLRAYNGEYGYYGNGSEETWTLYDVTHLPSIVVSESGAGSGGVSVFNDLGEGVVYGSTTVSQEDVETWVEVTLTSAAVSAIPATGGSFLLGGRLSVADPSYGSGIFDGDPGPVELILERVVPFPISSVSPSAFEDTSSRIITISGSDFHPDATLTFDPPTRDNIASTASKLTYVDSTEIQYDINTGGDPGTWWVRVNNPSDSSNYRSFTVTVSGSFTLSNETPYWDPAPPTGPAVQLNWTYSQYAGTYALYRNGSVYEASLTGTSYLNELNLTPGTTYSYFVRASNAEGTTDSNTIQVKMPSGPESSLAAPSTLEAQAFVSRVELGWTDNSSDEDGFKIERKEGSGLWSQIGTTGSNFDNSDFYTDNSTSPNSTYSYRVRAYNSDGNSDYSSTVTFTTPGSKPGSFTLSNDSPYWDSSPPAGPAVQLNWTSSQYVGAYALYRNGSVYQAGLTGNSYLNELDLTPGATYSYFVRASNAEGTTDSNTIQVQMPSDPGPSTPVLFIEPEAPVLFVRRLVGTYADRTFRVSNLHNSQLVGNAAVGTPFRVISGGSYVLEPGQSHTVTVRYSPVSMGSHSAHVTFTGGDEQHTRQVKGASFSAPESGTGTLVGTVTRSDTHEPLDGVLISAAPGVGLFGGIASRSGKMDEPPGSYSIEGLEPGSYVVKAYRSESNLYYMEILSGVTIVAGEITSLDIELTPILQPQSLTPEQTPVILVRGRGEDLDWDDGESDSWGEMRYALEEAGFENVWICNEPDYDGGGKVPSFPVYDHVINGESSIESNAGRLKNYIGQKVQQFKRDYEDYPATINIVAHSMGGLITRRAISFDTGTIDFDDSDGIKRRIKVGKVIMLGTPNAGSILATIEPGFWPGKWDSTKDLVPQKMHDDFNPANKWPSNVSLFLCGGVGGPDSPDSKLSAGAAFFAIRNRPYPPEQVSDGAVSLPSVEGMYYKKTFPLMRLKEITSVSLNPKIPWKVSYLDHFQLLTSPDVANWVISKLGGTQPAPMAAQASSMEMLDGGTASVMSADSVSETLPIQWFEQVGGTNSLSVTNKVAVVSDAATTLSFELFATTGFVFTVETPDGTVLDSTTPDIDTNVLYSVSSGGSNSVAMLYTVNNPTQGVWQAVLDSSTVVTQAGWYLMVSGDSPVALLPQTDSQFDYGQDVVISCALADVVTNPVIPVLYASINAEIQLPDGSSTNLLLMDDGFNHDSLPNDGLYATVMPTVQQAGSYSVSYRALAVNSDGVPLQRVANGTFDVSAGNGVLLGDPVYTMLDTTGDNLGNLLKVQCWVNLGAAGNYVISCDLVDTNSSIRLEASSEFSSTGSGAVMASMIMDLSEVQSVGLEGTFYIDNLKLFKVDAEGISWLDTYRGQSSVFIPSLNDFRLWQVAHGLPTDGSVDFTDMDGDGLLTWDEYIAGTDPTNRASSFRITENIRNTLGWNSFSGRVYSVWWTTNLLKSFQPLETNIPWTQGSYTNPDAPPCSYYKVNVQLEE